MSSITIQFLTQLPIAISHNHHRSSFAGDNNNHTTTKSRRRRRCFSGGSRWDWDKNVNPNRRSRFGDGYATDGHDEEEEEEEYGFTNAAKRRMWWSDDFYGDDDDDDEEDEVFGVLEASIGFNWVLKIFRAFGWMIPAVVISLLFGTGPNTIVMAIALPLAQSALSLAADTLWGRPDETPRPKSKSKKRPFVRTASRKRAKNENEIRFRTGNGAGNYKSWEDANNVSGENGKTSRQSFGGWDELDKEPRATPIKRVYEPSEQERVKISRTTKEDTPLFMRLLIAMFPYLGFWTKLF